jgi:hypothetical protein
MATYASYKTVDNPARVCYRIWSGYTKFIRQQCRKNRVVDTGLFGFFSKKQTSEEGDENIQYQFHYEKQSSNFPDMTYVNSSEAPSIPKD